MKTKLTILAITLFSALTVSAQGGLAQNIQGKDLGGILSLFRDILNTAVPVIISLGLIYFLWNIFMAIRKGPEGVSEAKGYIVWGIIFLTVMVSVWGLVKLIAGVAGVGDSSAVPVPTLPGTNGGGM